MKTIVLFILTTLLSCSCTIAHVATYHVDKCPNWVNCIKNPDNKEYIDEIAFNLNISPDKVTQEQFNDRYVTN